ncbi:PQQ-binding-like beta-propeller repeat protein [Pseudactinotalea sp.]|uniref:outer membrane protein assembly factor BamB family protein n=1 Tax=Pseudactinotalea sp. TaxID=1926260 RepID=UPI003B3BBB17
MTSTDEFILTEQLPGAAPTRTRRPLPLIRRAETWIAIAVALILTGVMITPGPIYPPLGDGIAWNVLDMDLTTEPDLAWETELPETAYLLGAGADTIAVAVDGEVSEDSDSLPALTILGLDATTGTQRWEIDDPDRSCLPDGTFVTCVQGSGEPEATISVYPATDAPPTVHDYPGAITAVALDDGGLLVAEGGGTGIAMLVRLDTEGEELWRSRLSVSGQAGPGEISLEANGGYVAVSGGILYDLATGERMDQSMAPVDVAQDGSTRRGGFRGPTVVTTADGTEFLVPPGELWLGVDDAFGGPVSLTFDGDGSVVSTYDGRSERVLPEGIGWPFARLNGVLLVYADDPTSDADATLIGVDELTGNELWRRVGDLSQSLWPFRWGSVPASADTIVLSSAGRLDGIDPRTGEARWSISLDAESADVHAVDGGLLAWSGGVLTMLR